MNMLEHHVVTDEPAKEAGIHYDPERRVRKIVEEMVRRKGKYVEDKDCGPGNIQIHLRVHSPVDHSRIRPAPEIAVPKPRI